MQNNIEENVPLKKYASFRIGGEARYFCLARNEEEIKGALDFAITNKLKVFVLGNGSNLLISDQGFDGLVLKLQNSGVEVKAVSEGFEADVESGTFLSKLVLDLAKQGVGGLEWAAGIPALVGGAVCNNAGAYGKSMSDLVKTIKVLKMFFDEKEKYLEKYEEQEMDLPSCGFSYRESVFKKTKNFLILSVVLSLQKADAEKVQAEIKERVSARIKKQPLEYPNIGSIFKNPVLTSEEIAKVAEECSDTQVIFSDNKIAAGFLIEQIGFKGKKVGGAMVSEKHANFIVNVGDARAEDVVILISLVKQKVRQKFGIQLHEEIEYVGF